MRICHLTSVHHRDDTRIFIKEIPALVDAGYDVSVVVADGKGDEKRDGYSLYDVGKSNGRLNRIFRLSKKVRDKASKIDADVYHFHDPELIPVGLHLIRRGKKVVYDIHEDVPMSIMSKDWIPALFRKIIALNFRWYENRGARKFHALVTATPFINDRFRQINRNSVNINNYPVIGELDQGADWSAKEQAVCYIGEITRIRSAVEMVKAMESVAGTLYLAGTMESDTLHEKLKQIPSWPKVEDMGYVDRKTYASVLSRSMAGLVVFYPESNHINAQPNKIFEYMSAGVPVIGSDFPLWKRILEDDDCGLCVNPLHPEQLSAAINRLLGDPELAERMGSNGRKMVLDKYNWEHEKIKLLELYKTMKEDLDSE
ncbi:MAG: glycosyltransferase [Bacteroidota bacterium]|nr:glycosyltransferase [Bacteroidota bacterium]